MDILSLIQGPIKSELDLLNNSLRDSLITENNLLNSVVDYYLESKGKQIRPMLVLLGARLFGEVSSKTVDAAVAVELLHNASLIHDDVVDETLVRRGRSSVNACWDNKIAVLVGDYFVSTALQRSLATRDVEIVDCIASLGKELSLGEIDQLNNQRSHILSEDAYYRVIRQKTASLFMACMRMGALSVNAPEEDCAVLEAFGEKLGLCFQIKDDIFDYYDSLEIGKPTGNDIREGKVTLPLIYAISHASEEERTELLSMLKEDQISAENVHKLVDFAKRKGGIEYAERKMEQLSEEGELLLDRFHNVDVCRSLKEILQYTISRHK